MDINNIETGKKKDNDNACRPRWAMLAISGFFK